MPWRWAERSYAIRTMFDVGAMVRRLMTCVRIFCMVEGARGGYGLPDAGLTGYITFSHDVVGVLGEEPPRRIPVGAITRPLRLYRRIGAHRWSSL